MFNWLKRNIFQPIGAFFSNAWSSVRNFFAGEPQTRTDYQPIPADLSQPDNHSGEESPISSHSIDSPSIQTTTQKLNPAPASTLPLSESSHQQTTIDDLVEDNFKEIASHLDDETVFSFALASKQHTSMFKPGLLKMLLEHVVKGDQAKAEGIIKLNPGLLLETATATDYSGRIIKGTALQAALGAEDVKYHDDEECMVEMIIKHLKTLPDGEAKIQQQVAGQLPEGWEQAEAERVQRDGAALNAVINAIRDSQDGDDCEAAIRAFRDYLDGENKGKVFGAGKHFNHQLLVEAFNLYKDNYHQFGGFNSRQNNLCWRKVIGYIQRYIPAATAQAFCQGVYSITADNEKLSRVLNFRYGGEVYYPLDSSSDFRLGYMFAAGLARRGVAGWARVRYAFASFDFKTYVKQKQQAWGTYAARVESSRNVWAFDSVR